MASAAQLALKMLKRKIAVERELSKEARGIAQMLRVETGRIINSKIYNRPIPKSSTGQPLWARTGDLRRAERAHADRTTVVLVNREKHALYRHRLGLPGYRKPKYTLSVQWHTEAFARHRREILRGRREAVLRALKRS